MKTLSALPYLFYFLATPPLLAAVSYYVNPTGDNSRSGTSEEQAWQTISRVNEGHYGPGDKILFQAGQTFTGSLYFDPNNSGGTALEPITVSSYGGGPAVISTKDGEHGLYAYNVGGFHITGLNFAGAMTHCGIGGLEGGNGIYFYSDSGVPLSHIYIDQADISGYCIGIAANANLPGEYEDIWLNQLTLHDNLGFGIFLMGSQPDENSGYPINHVSIGHSQIYNQSGLPYEEAGVNKSGSAIVLDQVDNAVIEHNTVFNNGGQNTCIESTETKIGPYGIWANGSRISIQSNEVYGQHVAPDCPGNGGAFQITGSESIVQYNYSHDNEGLAIFQENTPDNQNNIIRYNISENDSLSFNRQGIIRVAGGSGNYEIYNNTVYANHEAGSQGPLIAVASSNGYGTGNPTGVHFRNNLFVSNNPEALLMIVDPQNIADLRFENNAYYDNRGNYLIYWGGPQYLGIGTWAQATDQEKVNGKIVAHILNPLLCSPGSGGIISPKPLTALTAYELQENSPLVDAGWDLASQFGLDPGKQDFFSNPVPAGGSPDIGAHEYQTGQTCQ